ncbi:SDR family oxidoreductase [Arcanobacterium haemolyticum]|nr:SDR family oxidoreductase [Arcanobacterium haemolyticum]
MAGGPGTASRILITGASRGIGRHLALGLARRGRTLVLVARKASSLDAVAAECEELGASVCAVGCDLAKPGDIEQMLDVVVADGGADMVVNCAGVFGDEVAPWEGDTRTWWRTQEINVRAPYLIQHRLVPLMLKNGGGRVLDLSSGAAIKDRDDSSGYYVAKTALFRLGSSMHEAGFAQGLRVLEMAPGVVLTDMTRDMKMHEGRTEWTAPEDVVAIAQAFADGELDGLSGSQVRAGADDLGELRKRSALRLASGAAESGSQNNERRLRLMPWKNDDVA